MQSINLALNYISFPRFVLCNFSSCRICNTCTYIWKLLIQEVIQIFKLLMWFTIYNFKNHVQYDQQSPLRKPFKCCEVVKFGWQIHICQSSDFHLKATTPLVFFAVTVALFVFVICVSDIHPLNSLVHCTALNSLTNAFPPDNHHIFCPQNAWCTLPIFSCGEQSRSTINSSYCRMKTLNETSQHP